MLLKVQRDDGVLIRVNTDQIAYAFPEKGEDGECTALVFNNGATIKLRGSLDALFQAPR